MCHVAKTSHKAYPESANTLAACAKVGGRGFDNNQKQK